MATKNNALIKETLANTHGKWVSHRITKPGARETYLSATGEEGQGPSFFVHVAFSKGTPVKKKDYSVARITKEIAILLVVRMETLTVNDEFFLGTEQVRALIDRRAPHALEHTTVVNIAAVFPRYHENAGGIAHANYAFHPESSGKKDGVFEIGRVVHQTPAVRDAATVYGKNPRNFFNPSTSLLFDEITISRRSSDKLLALMDLFSLRDVAKDKATAAGHRILSEVAMGFINVKESFVPFCVAVHDLAEYYPHSVVVGDPDKEGFSVKGEVQHRLVEGTLTPVTSVSLIRTVATKGGRYTRIRTIREQSYGDAGVVAGEACIAYAKAVVSFYEEESK